MNKENDTGAEVVADIADRLRRDKHRLESFEPLKPEIEWTPTTDGSYHAAKGGFVGTIKFPPSAYAHGFEDGVFALARKLFELMRDDKKGDAMFLISNYGVGKGRPLRGWKTAPPR
jgi:hypothetical protein